MRSVGDPYLDLAGLWAAEALLHLHLEEATALQRGHAGDVPAAVLTAGVHGRVARDVLLQRGRRGEHLMQVAWRGEEEEERGERGGERGRIVKEEDEDEERGG